MAPAPSKMMLISGLVATASAFAPMQQGSVSTALFNGPVLGAGGMADTRDPDAQTHEDPRKSIGEAPSFEEYLKQRSGDAGAAAAPAAGPPANAFGAPAAPAPAAAAPPAWGQPAAAAPAAAAPPAWGQPAAPPAAAAPPAWGQPAAAAAPAAPAAPAVAGGGTVVDTLASLEGPGMVWGDQGVALGHEESDLKGYDSFGKFYQAMQSTGVAAELAGAGPFTIFAPTDSAMNTYEQMRGPVDANLVKLHIVPGLISSADVPNADLTSLAGTPLHYRYAVRKHFVNDAIIGEKSFGPYPDYPIDVACSNGVIHAVGLHFGLY